MNLIKLAEIVIRSDGESLFPDECCGFLYGTEGSERTITLALPVINSKVGDKRRRFEISPFEYMKAEQFALENDLTLLGVYHSHPNHRAIPSVHDLAKALPYFSYIIVSVLDGKADKLRSWRLTEEGDAFEEEVVYLRGAGSRSEETSENGKQELLGHTR